MCANIAEKDRVSFSTHTTLFPIKAYIGEISKLSNLSAASPKLLKEHLLTIEKQ